MSKNIEYLYKAAKIAIPKTNQDLRHFWLAAIGIRSDGAIVSSKNGSCGGIDRRGKFVSNSNNGIIKTVHAEGRVLQKMDKGGVLYVSRVSRQTGKLAMARPCEMCQKNIFLSEIEKVIYSINEDHYGIWFPSDDNDRIYSLDLIDETFIQPRSRKRSKNNKQPSK